MSYISCTYCGGMHKRGEICSSKPSQSVKKNTTANRYRNTHKWRKKAEAIKRRDSYLCQCCIRLMQGTIRRYEFDNLSVHHIVPIHVDETKKADDYNLITLCRYHHEEAEKGNINSEVLKKIVVEQMDK